MNKEKYCPECGELIGADERFCPNCGMELPVETEEKDIPVVGAGARANIMGGINKTTTTHNNVNTSNVDNSSTVNHNTTYVVNEKKKEFCEVCGNPLEEKHARCPKCGKEICLECKVKGKNRCVECERKAMDDYRVAFQQFLLSSNGNLGTAGRQMMNQKARELNVEDVKDEIEKELLDDYKPALKAVQPDVVPVATSTDRVTTTLGSKGMSDSRKAIKTNKENNLVWIIIIAILVAIIIAFLLLNGDKKANEGHPSDSMEQVLQEQVGLQTKEVQTEMEASRKAESLEQPVVVEEPVSQPEAENKTDANYDAGMKAYEAGNGLDAVSAFKKSGSAKAYYMLGLIYENGCGTVGKNAMMARKNFKKAAQMGSSEAKAKL